MDTAHPQKFPFILDRNSAKANCTGNHVCTSCDTVVLGHHKTLCSFKASQVTVNRDFLFKKGSNWPFSDILFLI